MPDARPGNFFPSRYDKPPEPRRASPANDLYMAIALVVGLFAITWALAWAITGMRP